MKIALAGNPNSGKTTLFNAITGKLEYVGNWPGVTVAKKEAKLKRKYDKFIKDALIVDLPGAYSVAPFTGDEAITSQFILDEGPDVIINIVDASTLERSLFFSTQLLELNIPMIIALNKQDLVKAYGNKIDVEGLAQTLQCQVVETTTNEEEGLTDLIQGIVTLIQHPKDQLAPDFQGKNTEHENEARQKYVKSLVSQYLIKKRNSNQITLTDKVDRIVAHSIYGLPIFGLIMWMVYAFSINGIGGYLSGLLNDQVFGDILPRNANHLLESIGVHPLLQSLIVDGALAGMGAVIGFLPLIMVLFFCLSLLEDSGYMARVAVVMDRYFKTIGLSGKSIIPMIVGSGCSIPGIMATRTIEDINEKRMTTMLTPFVPCGAKLPIIALFSVVFFPDASWVGPSIYLLAFGIIALSGLMLKKIFVWKNTSLFIIELPEYKWPSIKHATKQMLKQAQSFLVKASTIILVMNTIVWFMQSYNWTFQVVEDPSQSILASVGYVIAPLLIPIGFVGWQLAAAAITGFIAKENVVATFAILLAGTSMETLNGMNSPLTGLFTPVTAYAFLAFNLFTPPCFAAIGAMNSELIEKKWLLRAVLFQLTVGYMLSLVIAQLGTLIVYGHAANGALGALIVTSVFIIGMTLFVRRAARIKKVS